VSEGSRIKRAIGGIYSYAADTLYEPLVVNGAFKLFGGDLNSLVMEQGRAAVTSAGGDPILDLPVGTGFFTQEIARRHGGLVVGVDIAWGMVRKAAVDARSAGLNGMVLLQGDAHRLPFGNDSFAAVVCSNGLQVMPGLRPSVHEMVRVLRSGGRMFVSVVLAPLGGVLPGRARDHLPTLMRPARDVARVLEDAGMADVRLSHRRLAGLIEAVKL
jgi:ubiquinone/menaquinone biosynthesis C-methylase UbiE